MHKIFTDAPHQLNGRIDIPHSKAEKVAYGMSDSNRDTEVSPFANASHFELVRVIERMYRRYLDRLRVDLNRIGADDISPSHAMLLFTIGDDDLSVRDLMDRGHYLGSNASYSLKQLVQSGYVDRTASARDKRSARISLTDKGKALCKAIKVADEVNEAQIVRNERDRAALEETFALLRKLEVIWATDLQQRNGHLANNGF